MGELPSSGVVGAVRAEELLTEAGRLTPGRRPVAGLWPPLVIFGAVAVADAPLSALSALAATAWWVIAAPAAFAGVGRCSSWQARRRGVQGPARRLSVLGMASFAAGWLACLGLGVAARLPGGLVWTIAVSIGYLAWSRFARSLPVAVIAVALAAVGAALALSPAPAWSVPLGVGAVMITGGLVLRYGPEAS